MALDTPESSTLRLDADAPGQFLSWSAEHSPVTIPTAVGGVPTGVSRVTSAGLHRTSRGRCQRAGLARASLQVVHIEQSDGTLPVPALPPRVLFEVHAVSGEATSLIAAARWTPVAWSGQFLLQVSGLLTEGFELRACVDPATPGPAVVRQLSTRLRWVVDRGGGGFELVRGEGVAVTSSPIVKV